MGRVWTNPKKFWDLITRNACDPICSVIFPNASRATYLPHNRFTKTMVLNFTNRVQLYKCLVKTFGEDLHISFALFDISAFKNCVHFKPYKPSTIPSSSKENVFFSPSLKDERRLLQASYAAGKKPVLFKQRFFISTLSTSRPSLVFRPASAHLCLCALCLGAKLL